MPSPDSPSPASPESPASPSGLPGFSRGGRRALILGGVAVAVGAGAAYRRFRGGATRVGRGRLSAADAAARAEQDLLGLGWGDLDIPEQITVTTPDGAHLAV